MLDIKEIRKNPDQIKKQLATRAIPAETIDDLLVNDSKRREIIQVIEELKAKRNAVTDEIAAAKRAGESADEAIAQMQTVGDEIKKLDDQLRQIDEQVASKAAMLPNLPDASVPVGADDQANLEISKWGEIKETSFEPKAHYQLGEELGILDFERGAKVSGARFLYYLGAGARLERAIYNFMLDQHNQEGYTELITPIIVNDQAMYGTGQFPKFQEDAYRIEGVDQTLIPTAEVPLTNYYADEVIDENLLPIKFTALSPSFRQEAGAAGRDTRGLIRLHQFNKVEMVKFTKPEQSYQELELMRENAESLLQKLELPYRVVTLSTGDMGFSAAKTYDLEVWMPEQGRYREISSVSNAEAFQARRAHIQYRDQDNKLQFVHTLNGSGLAVGRTVAAILENYQNADGSITIPKVLVSYFGESKIVKEAKE